MTMETMTARQVASLPAIRLWLVLMAALVFAMAIVGGATRLTDSGLSITEWKPLLGAIPPLNEADWNEAFEKYKRIPEYQIVNRGMPLAEFKFIYWWEWGHRFLGRFIGVAFLLPLVFFAATGRIASVLRGRLAAIFVLGGLQGALGWYMVSSGLVARVDVSQYRLAAHLTLAAAIFAAIVWLTFGLEGKRRRPRSTADWFAAGIAASTLLQIAAGAFVAGLDAGMGYNTWPLMDGKLVPRGLFAMEPGWRNFFENAMTVQFNHRLLAYAIAIAVMVHAILHSSRGSFILRAALLAQIVIGIATLLAAVPLWLGLVHQGGALVVLSAALWNLHDRLRR
jgi:cytochrome c oxidase assembly protein subunit 15